MFIPDGIQSNFISIDGIKLHYLCAGQGETVLLLHGWPTSAFLYRNMILPLSEKHQVIAIDLPGFGLSEKPSDVSYSLNFYNKIIDHFLTTLKIKKVNLVVHDLGGPIGLLWAVRHREKILRLIFLNTLVYKQFSWAVILFTLAAKLPLVKNWLSSAAGIAFAFKIGVFNQENVTPEMLENYQATFQTRSARAALLKAATNVSLKAFDEIEAGLPKFDIPVQLIYGEADRILPDVAKTMARLKEDLPQASIHPLPNCGHFLQEDQPIIISELILDFLNK